MNIGVLRLQRGTYKTEQNRTMAKRKGTERQTMIHNALQRRLKIEYHESHKNPMVKSGSPEE